MEVASGEGAGDVATLAAGADETSTRPRRRNERLRARRGELGLSRKQLAERAGLSASRYATIENGSAHRPASPATAAAIAALLGVDVADIFEIHPCECGCGELTLGRLRPGHHARLPGFAELLVDANRPRARERLETRGLPEEKTCERCGRTFTRWDVVEQNLGHWAARRYCSRECAHPLENLPRPCAYCGETFVGRRGHPEARYCSVSCASRDLFATKLEHVSDAVLRQLRGGLGSGAEQLIRQLPAGARRRRLLGPLTGAKAPARESPARGRPPVELPPEVAAEVRRLSGSWGEQAIATRLSISRRQVRKALDRGATAAAQQTLFGPKPPR